jgi:superfamily II DNA or RNA helicase
VVDECHITHKPVTREMELSTDRPRYFLGLSATPYSRDLGLLWPDLIVPISQEDLLANGFLAPVHYYGGTSLDTSGIRTKRLSTGSHYLPPDSYWLTLPPHRHTHTHTHTHTP